MTRVAVHQPNFLPYPGFFHKLSFSDVFVLYDTAQFSKNDYHNRNRIKTPKGPAWLTVPVRSPSHRTIKDVEIDNDQRWGKRLWQSIEANYARAPFFEDLADSFRRVLVDEQWTKLAELNAELIELVRVILGLGTKVVRASTLVVGAEDATTRIIEMVRAVGGTVYLSGPLGRDYLRTEEFVDVSLAYLQPPTAVYPQLWGPFVPNLSILDAILNCGPDARSMVLDA